MAVTIREVARRAGVSAMTVSRVINGGTGVRTETRQRVEQVVSDLNYVPSRVARGLTSNKSGTLGMVIPDVINPFFANIVAGAELVTRRAGYRMLLCNSEGDLNQERRFLEDILSYRAEGALVIPVSDQSKDNLAILTVHDVPFVLIDRSIGDVDCDSVESDNISGARMVTEHLLGLGRRRIAMIMLSAESSTDRGRRTGYQQALEAAGVAYDPDLVFLTSFGRNGGYRSMQQILALDPRPDAVFAVNNMTALGAMDAMRENGVAMPEDLPVVHFDEVEQMSVRDPFMTVVEQPSELFGTLGAELLLERIAGHASAQTRSVKLPPRLIVRESCGSRLP